MPLPAAPSDVARLSMRNVVHANDTAELDARSRVSGRLAGTSRAYRCRQRDSGLWRMRFGSRVFGVAIRSAGAMLASHGESRFATEVSVSSDESDVFGFSTPLQGHLALVQRGSRTTTASSGSLAHRLGPDTRLASTDRCAIGSLPPNLSHDSR
jgi:hypothetical protein